VVGNRVEPGDEARAHCDQPAGQTARGAAAGHRVQVHPGLGEHFIAHPP
jgi:hypothetical protein